MRCQKAIDILKNLLIHKENAQNVLPEPNISNDQTTADKHCDTFDLWSYHASVATEQVKKKVLLCTKR